MVIYTKTICPLLYSYLNQSNESTETIKDKLFDCIMDAYAKHTGGLGLYKNTYEFTLPGGKSIAVYYNDILCFEISSISHRVVLRPQQRVIDLPEQLNTIEKKLNNDFVRCHRSVIVNLKNIKEIDYNNCIITLRNGSTCPLSTRKKGVLKSRMKSL